MIELKHPFVNKCPDIDALLKNDNGEIIQSIESFCYRIKKQSERNVNLIEENDYKGWALETFAEYLIKANGSDNRIGIWDYKVVGEDDDEDFGVDGHGIGANSHPITVQVKYRTGDYILTAKKDDLSNFLAASWNDYNVPIECTENMLLITTGLKVDEQSRDKMLKNKVRVLNRDNLRSICDNRAEFWVRFYDSFVGSRVKVEPQIKPLSLRLHQQEAINEILKDTDQRGKIILPTGTGKTIIQAELIRQKILEYEKLGQYPVIKVNASRILLCFQLFEEVCKYLNSYGISAHYINFNSGNAEDKYYAIMMRKSGGLFRSIVSSTSINSVKDQIHKAQKEKIPLIIFSTYHSSDKFEGSDIKPDLTLYDEAHNLVGKEFSNAAQLPSKANFYFTATEKVTDSSSDLGMNNEDRFGNVIFQKSAKEMIERGEMVQPRIHVIKSRGDKINIEKTDCDYGVIFQSVISSFDAHSKQIKEDSYDGSKIGGKVLVVCRGQQDLIEMFKTKEYELFKIMRPKVHIFALSSEFGMLNDGEWYRPPVTNMKKYHMLKKLKELRSDEEAIIFHVDMIGEGIDVPGITGVIPFRNCEMSKFIQNIGRAARLHSYDRKRFYEGEINPGIIEKYIKPYSWIIIPTFLINSEGFADRFKSIIWKLRGEYGINKETVLISNDKGFSDEEVIDVDNVVDKNKRHTKSGIEGFEHEFEDMSLVEKVIWNQEQMIEASKHWEKVEKIKEQMDKDIFG